MTDILKVLPWGGDRGLSESQVLLSFYRLLSRTLPKITELGRRPLARPSLSPEKKKNLISSHRQVFIPFSVFCLFSSYQRSEWQTLNVRLNGRKCPLPSPHHLHRWAATSAVSKITVPSFGKELSTFIAEQNNSRKSRTPWTMAKSILQGVSCFLISGACLRLSSGKLTRSASLRARDPDTPVCFHRIIPLLATCRLHCDG